MERQFSLILSEFFVTLMFSTTCNVWTKLGLQTEYQKKGSRSKKTYNIYMNEHRCHMYVDKFLTEARLWPRSG